MEKIENLVINTLRFLSADQIQSANSGHPGLPFGAAPCVFSLFFKILEHNPKNPKWINRDRFVLSAGHGSSLLYSALHLLNYGIGLDDLKNFRQLGSLTPGHPEFGHTSGVEVTTGPLGQGIANAVGFALAEKFLAEKFNKKDFPVISHFTYCLCGDGCLMEGISAEACSLAGTLNLNKLIILYDSNNITIEGNTSIAFQENVKKRFESYNFNVLEVKDANDINAIENAIKNAQNSDKPTFIEIKSQIGYGSPNKAGKASAHGEPFGEEEISLSKKFLDFEFFENFSIPQDVKIYAQNRLNQLELKESKWNQLFSEYSKNFPDLSKEFDLWFDDKHDFDLINNSDFWDNQGDLATRISSEIILNKVCNIIPNLIGGSADLAPSTKTIMKNQGDFSQKTPSGRNLHFGVREHAMSAISNGISLHGGLKIYVSGFFVFSDYMKPAMRLSALMGLPIINILTHDSIGVGEDGPTHQPIEHLTALRSIPNFTVFRPCDSNETSAAWCYALSYAKGPVGIILTRQNLKLLKETGKEALKGAYILKDSKNPDLILIASGSEVSLIYDAYDELISKGRHPRIVSMPSIEIFEKQSNEYKDYIFPKNIRKRLGVEAGTGIYLQKYVGLDGIMISMETFGESGKASQLFEKYGFTVENVVEKALQL